MPEDDVPPNSLAQVGYYEELSDAREHGLVVSAMDRPHWIVRQGSGYALCVEGEDRERVVVALAEFEGDQASGAVPPPMRPIRIPVNSLCVAIAIMVWFYWFQISVPSSWVDHGVADSQAIFAGEWWRVVTALTIHGGSEHLIANLGIGTFFLAVAMARFGGGIGALACVLSGALGNFLNAWFYRHEAHTSVGASTGIFGAVGLIVGAELGARLLHRSTRTRGQMAIPIGVGLALLALFGSGERDSQVDSMAHFWGLVAGGVIGVVFYVIRLKAEASKWLQLVAGLGSLAILLNAWSHALPKLPKI